MNMDGAAFAGWICAGTVEAGKILGALILV
jgi:hypothetical protein